MLSLSRLWGAYKLELRLLVWHWSFALLVALYSLMLIGSNFGGYNAETLLMYSFSLATVQMLSLGAVLFAGLSVGRADRSHMHLIEDTLPTGIELPLARWLAVFSVTMLFLLPPLVIALIAGPLESYLAALPTFLLESLSVLAIMSALVWLLYRVIGNRRWLFPFLVILWLGLGIGPGIMAANFTNIIGDQPWFILYSIPASAFNSYSYSEIWGRLSVGDLPVYTSLTYAALLVLMLAGIALLAFRQRFYQLSPLLVMLSVVAFAGVVMGTIGYQAEAQVPLNFQDARTEFVQSHSIDNSWQLPPDLPYTITEYDIMVDFNDAENPAYTASMILVNRGDEPLNQFSLSLNPQLTVHSLSLPYERDEDHLYISLDAPLMPEETLQAALEYSGNIWWYNVYTIGRPNAADYFTTPSGVHLSCAIGWYPVPGTILVGRGSYMGLESPRSVPDCLLDTNAAFDVTVVGGESMTWASNLPETDAQRFSGDAAWVNLMAAPQLVTEQVETITIVASETSLDNAREVTKSVYLPALAHLQGFFPEVQALNLWVLDMSYSYNDATPQNEGRLTVIARPYNLQAFDTSPANAFRFGMESMVMSLFGTSMFFSEPVADNIAYFLEVMRLTEGDVQAMQTMLTEGIPAGEGGTIFHTSQTLQERYPVAFALYDEYETGGEARIREILQSIQADFERLDAMPIEEVATWVRDYAD